MLTERELKELYSLRNTLMKPESEEFKELENKFGDQDSPQLRETLKLTERGRYGKHSALAKIVETFLIDLAKKNYKILANLRYINDEAESEWNPSSALFGKGVISRKWEMTQEEVMDVVGGACRIAEAADPETAEKARVLRYSQA